MILLNLVKKILRFILKLSPRWKIIILAGLGILVFIVIKFAASSGTDGYVIDQARKRTITEMVTESGNVTSNGAVDLFSPSTGIIDEVYVANGDQVQKGQQLFSVISTATSGQQAEALAAYQAAKSAVQEAENNRRLTSATVDRVHDDLKNKDTTETFTQKETRTTAEVANDNAYDSLLAAQAQLSSAQIAYQATQNAMVAAPINGIASNLSVIKGSPVSVNIPQSPSQPVLVIGQIGYMEVKISVSESDINKIRVGQSADVRLDAIPNKVFTGHVVRFDQYGTFIQGVVKFNVYIDFDNSDTRIKSGMSADVDVITNELTDVLSVPNAAIKPYQKGRAVRYLNNGQIEYLPVEIGIRGKEFTQITGGLEEDRQIVVSLTNEKAQRSSPFGF